MSEPKHSSVAVCIYDNPATMARECWENGVLRCKYDAELFFLPSWPVPASKFFFGANVGPWKTGQLIGNKDAMKNGDTK